MALEFKISKGFNGGGKKFAFADTIETEQQTVREQSIPAAKTGSLSLRSSNTAGNLTMAAGHGIATGNRLDVYWSGGCRRGVVVGSVATNLVPISGGDGDNLPAQDTAITAMVPVSEVLSISGDDIKGIAVETEAKGQFVFAQSDNTELWNRIFKADAGGDGWYDGSPDVNPLAGETLEKIFMSHGDSTKAQKIRYVIAHD